MIELLAEDSGRSNGSPLGRIEANTLLGEAWLELGRPELALPILARCLEEIRSPGQATADGSGSVVGSRPEKSNFQTGLILLRGDIH